MDYPNYALVRKRDMLLGGIFIAATMMLVLLYATLEKEQLTPFLGLWLLIGGGVAIAYRFLITPYALKAAEEKQKILENLGDAGKPMSTVNKTYVRSPFIRKFNSFFIPLMGVVGILLGLLVLFYG